LRENSRKVDQEKSKWSSEKLNIGIIGEPYVCWDERANYGIEQKIVELGANPVNTVGFGDFLRERADEKFEHIPFVHFTRPEKRPFRAQAQTYFNGAVGGYALANMYNLLWLSDKKVDGLIHLLPLSCAFESMIEEYINAICRDAEIPLLRIAIDENYSESNFDTRMETFIKLIQRRKAR
jgi:predicted nucleotide-binding protein (sugar kinase/HSP70/actin superfamily)